MFVVTGGRIDKQQGPGHVQWKGIRLPRMAIQVVSANKASDHLGAESQVLVQGKAAASVTAFFSNVYQGVLWASSHPRQALLKYEDLLESEVGLVEQ